MTDEERAALKKRMQERAQNRQNTTMRSQQVSQNKAGNKKTIFIFGVTMASLFVVVLLFIIGNNMISNPTRNNADNQSKEYSLEDLKAFGRYAEPVTVDINYFDLVAVRSSDGDATFTDDDYEMIGIVESIAKDMYTGNLTFDIEGNSNVVDYSSNNGANRTVKEVYILSIDETKKKRYVDAWFEITDDGNYILHSIEVANTNAKYDDGVLLD